MTEQFEDIKITSLDESASRPSGQGALMCLVLRLSQTAPSYWAQFFNETWKQQLYAMKRRAAVSGSRLEIICMPDELDVDHLPELKKVIAEANQAYRAHAANEQRRQEQEAAEHRRQKEALAKLNKTLKFD